MSGANIGKMPGGSDTRPSITIDTSDLPDAVTVDLDSKDANAFEVEVVDDAPENLRGPTEVEQPTHEQEEELRDVSSRVKKRIDRLRYEAGTHERAAAENARQRDAAIEEARRAREEADQLRQQNAGVRESQLKSMRTAREEALTNAKSNLKRAIEDGDAGAQADAQALISSIASELTFLATQAVQRPQPKTEQPAPTPAPQPAPNVHPKVRAWANHNERWFGPNRAKTDAAVSVYWAIKNRGVNEDSAEFYAEMDKGLAEIYPDHIPFKAQGNGAARRDPNPSVPSGGRDNGVATGNGGGPRKVTLTSSQVAIAKKLGVSVQAYAAEIAKNPDKYGGAR